MNMLGGNTDKKKLIIIISIALVVIIALIVWLFLGGNSTSKKTDDTQDSPLSQDTGLWNENGKYDYEQTVQEPLEGSEAVQVVIPTSMYGGTIDGYLDNSTSANLTINIGGDVDKKKTFKLVPKGIVFDASKNTVVKPSSLTKGVGTNVRVLALGDTQTGVETVEVVIIHDKPTLLFSPIMKVSSTDKGAVLVNDYTQTKYIVSKDAKLVNALSGETFEIDKFKSGDRVFFYEGEAKPVKRDKKENVDTSGQVTADYKLEDVEKPSKEDIKKEEELTKNYKSIEVKNAFVYPSSGQ